MIVKIFGGPGCGKTYRLLEIFSEKLKTNKIDEICFTSFTRKARDVAKQRIKQTASYNSDNKCLDWVGTTHSICARLIGFDKTQALKPKHKKEICKEFGVEYVTINKNMQNELEATFDQKECIGNQLFDIINGSRLKMITLDEVFYEKVKNDSVDINIDLRLVKRFAEAYRKYKREHNLLDYTDMLEYVYVDKIVPPTRVLFVDEFQDLTPLQYEIYKIWSAASMEVYIAGDDDQALFRWAGASSDLFLDAPCDKIEILHKTYRLPPNILKLVQKLIVNVERRQHKDIISSKRDDGKIIYFDLNFVSIDQILDSLLDSNSICMQFRTNYLVYSFSKELIGRGVAFTGSYSPWSEDIVNVNNALEKIKKNNKLNYPEIRSIILNLPSKEFIRYGIKKEFKKKEGELELSFDEVKSSYFRLTEWDCTPTRLLKSITITDNQRDSISKKLILKPGLIDEINIYLTNIHKFKGDERDVVVVFLSMTKKIADSIEDNRGVFDDEIRTYYTAMTRPKKDLIIVKNYLNCENFQEVFFDDEIGR